MSESESESESEFKERRRKEISRRQFLQYMMLLATGMIFAPIVIKSQDLKNTILLKKPTMKAAVPDYHQLMMLHLRWLDNDMQGPQPVPGYYFLGGPNYFTDGPAGGNKERFGMPNKGDRLFFNPLVYIGPANENDLDTEGIDWGVNPGSIKITSLGRLTTGTFETRSHPGKQSIYDGYFFTSEPLSEGDYSISFWSSIPDGADKVPYKANIKYRLRVVS